MSISLTRQFLIKEGRVLFNGALNTFYLWLYGVRHMIKDHSNSERGNCCRHMGYSFQLAARVLLYASSHIYLSINQSIHPSIYLSISHRITHTTAFVTPVVLISNECFVTVGLKHIYWNKLFHYNGFCVKCNDQNSRKPNYSQNENLFATEKYEEFKHILDALQKHLYKQKKKMMLEQLLRLNIRQIRISTVSYDISTTVSIFHNIPYGTWT